MVPRIRAHTWSLAAACIAVLLSLAAVRPLCAQEEYNEPPPKPGSFEADTLPAKSYIVPDVKAKDKKKVFIESSWFKLKPQLVILEDYDAFTQDSASIAQVGKQKDQWDSRAFRFMLAGSIGSSYKVGYLFAVNYNGFNANATQPWSWYDISFTFPLAGPATTLTVGKTKETYLYEMVADAANLPQQERSLDPFFQARSVGLRVNQVFGERHTSELSGGIYNDSWVNGGGLKTSATNFTARYTWVAFERPDKHRWIHLGISARWEGTPNDTMVFAGRPVSHVSSLYVNTLGFAADHSLNAGLEAFWNERGFSLLGEYARAWVHAPASGDPVFDGWYAAASWFLLGEQRPYDRTKGYARRVVPLDRWGAPELVAQFTHVNLDDAAIHGGSYDRFGLGINWWATYGWKLGFGWGYIKNYQDGVTGITNSFQWRLQWVI